MLTKVHVLKAMVFLVVMYRCESWTLEKSECQRIDAFQLWNWRRLSRVPWTERRSNQSILKEINPEYSLERLMLKLKLHYSGHLMRRTDSLEKTLTLRKTEAKEKGTTEEYMVGWHHRLDGHEFEQILGDSGEQGNLACCSLWGHRVRHDLATEQQHWKCETVSHSVVSDSLQPHISWIRILRFKEGKDFSWTPPNEEGRRQS